MTFPLSHSLAAQGIETTATIHPNLTSEELTAAALENGEGRRAKDGPLVVETGKHTGRSAKDKFIVRDAETEDTVWWDNNASMTSEHFAALKEDFLKAVADKGDLYVADLFGGSQPEYRVNVRVINELAWHNQFIRTLLVRPTEAELDGFVPEYTIIDLPTFRADPERHGCRSETVIAVNLSEKLILIGGTKYAGEMKKSVFGILNYLLPAKGVMPMHCSANIGPDGKSAVFFGLSGTGKTTLSADASRTLIGDDEHGWSDTAVFNFEGGCYAKTINLTHEAEPEIYDLCHTFGSIIENVVMDPADGSLDFFDSSLTENGRVSYDISKVSNASTTGCGGQPKDIVMLTCDAFGVLPPISQLTPDQAMYHFLSGYTAKVAGTERGLKEPQATFSTCFGAPFMPRHPTVYAKLLGEKMATHNAKCWLVNTGWSGGGYGVGERMKIAYTRAMLHAALDGRLEAGGFTPDANFGVLVPNACPNVPNEVLNPKNTWADGAAYDAQARDLTQRFEGNFRQFEGHVGDSVKAAAIRAAA